MATVRAEQLVTPSPETASLFSKVVEKFAQTHGLRWQAKHQDDPIWQIWQEEIMDGKIIRRILQVSAYASLGDMPMLKAIALGQIIDEAALLGKVLRTPNVIGQKPLGQVKADSLMAFLDKSWAKVLEIQERDFPPETIKLPPRPGPKAAGGEKKARLVRQVMDVFSQHAKLAVNGRGISSITKVEGLAQRCSIAQLEEFLRIHKAVTEFGASVTPYWRSQERIVLEYRSNPTNTYGTTFGTLSVVTQGQGKGKLHLYFQRLKGQIKGSGTHPFEVQPSSNQLHRLVSPAPDISKDMIALLRQSYEQARRPARNSGASLLK